MLTGSHRASLKDVSRVAQLTADNIVSIGSSLSHVHVPGRKVDGGEDEPKESEVEIGMGIHNEPGSERKTTDLPGLVKTMLSHCLNESDKDRNFLGISEQDEVVLLVNNLGGVSVLELGGITNEVVDQLANDWNMHPVRILSGTYMTSLNGLGFSISLLKVTDTGLGPDSSMVKLLDAPAEACGWSAPILGETWSKGAQSAMQREPSKVEGISPSNLRGMDSCLIIVQHMPNIMLVDYEYAKFTLTTALKRLIGAEPDITRYDTVVGDGDCGIGLKRGAEGTSKASFGPLILIFEVAILKMLDHAKQTDDALIFLQNIIQIVELAMDGTSGAIYAIFLNALAHGLRQNSPSSPTPITANVWAKALDSSTQALGKYTPAKPGDRTLIDALYPFVDTLLRTGNVESAAKAAEHGAQGTKGMRASLGRTVYVGGEGWESVPDPGAHGLAELLLGLSEGLNK